MSKRGAILFLRFLREVHVRKDIFVVWRWLAKIEPEHLMLATTFERVVYSLDALSLTRTVIPTIYKK